MLWSGAVVFFAFIALLGGEVGAQPQPRGRVPFPAPDSSGFSVVVPRRGVYVDVPLSSPGWPFAPEAGPPAPPGAPAPPVAPAPPGAPAPRAPGRDSSDADSSGYQVIPPRASSPQPPPVGSGYFVVPKP